jgi:uncharacterized protein (TIGR02284 family)
MAIDTNDIRSTLNGLIETCKDGEAGFRTSAEELRDPQTRQLFESYANQRANFARDLQGLVVKTGGDAETSGSTAGALHRGWLNIKAAIAGDEDKAILEEAERGEDTAVKNYRDALAKDLPSGIRAAIERQYQDVQQTHNSVRALRDSAKTTTGSFRSTM